MVNKKINFLLLAMAPVLFAPKGFASSNFLIEPTGTLPMHVSNGGIVVADYTVTNLTSSSRTGYTVQGLPGTVVQNTSAGHCSNPINLNAKPASCNLQFIISGEVHSDFAICKGSSCTTSSAPLDISVNPMARIIYVANYYGSPTISVCMLDKNGLIESCQGAGQEDILEDIGPQGIVLNNNSSWAYITPSTGQPMVYQCAIDPKTRLFSACTSTTITSPYNYFPYYGMLTLNPSNTLAYLADNAGPGKILACPIINHLISGTCVNTGATNLGSYPSGITLNQAGTRAYIASYDINSVTVCNVNGKSFSSCIAKTGGGNINFSEPGQVALNADETIAYIADYGNNAVFGCSTAHNNTSRFDHCFLAATIENAWGITINAAHTMAYVSDYGPFVSQCPILKNGTFGTCTQSSFNDPVSTALGY